MNDVIYSKASENWETPDDLFNQLNAMYHFDLDVAADDNNAKCKRYYTKLVDGLLVSWLGKSIWCNPPYGRQIGKWVDKAIYEVLRGNADSVTMLLPARTDTDWFHRVIRQNGLDLRIVFVHRRLRFSGSSTNAPFPSIVIVMTRSDEPECRTLSIDTMERTVIA